MVFTLPNYEVTGTLGMGGMGVVYLGKHNTLNRQVAIKVLLENLTHNPQIRKRFVQEAELMDTLQHSNIVRLYDFTTDPRLCLIMEYVDGRGLDRMIGEEVGPIPYEKALPLFVQILEGIGYAHSKGIIHRDIKPSNILVSKDGIVKITDLGIAKIAGQKGMTKTGTKIGTLYYMSPEQVQGEEADLRSDIYALGMTLYEMLAGRLPFDEGGDTSEFQIMLSITGRAEHLDPREHYPHIPEWLVDIVQKATSKNAGDRFQTCLEFLQTIQQHASEFGSESGFWTEKVASTPRQETQAVHSPIPQSGTPAPESGEICPKCGSKVKDEMEFCGECGANLMQKCHGCSASIRWHRKYCPKCGIDIKKRQIELKQMKEKAERQRKEREQKQRAENERKRLEEKKRREVAEQRRKEREAEEKRIAEETEKLREEERRKLAEQKAHRIAWWKKHWWKVGIPAVIVIVGIERISYYNSDAYAYKQAEVLEDEHKWEEASIAYEALTGYRDSGYRMRICYVSLAGEYALSGDIPGAGSIVQEELCGNSDISLELASLLDAYLELAEYLLPSGMHFVSIPSGSFEMGSSVYSPERPVHTVYIDEFEMMTTEVTQGMWEEVMGSNPSHDKGVGSDYPVYYVSWNDCQEFIDRMNDIDPGHTYRLPSESEWEYGCRAGTTTRFYWGDDPDETEIDEYAWWGGNSGSSTHPVAQKQPNAWGLYDMSGNVWEWCEDKWHSNYDGAPTNGSAYTRSGSSRVRRGGSWYNYFARYCRSAYRYYLSPGYRDYYLGFRLSRD